MAMIIKMLWNGYVEMLLQFYMVSVVMRLWFCLCLLCFNCYHIYITNKSARKNKTKATYGEATYREATYGKGQKGKRQVAEGNKGTYVKRESEGICGKGKDEGIYVCIGNNGEYGDAIETYGKNGHEIVFARV